MERKFFITQPFNKEPNNLIQIHSQALGSNETVAK